MSRIIADEEAMAGHLAGTSQIIAKDEVKPTDESDFSRGLLQGTLVKKTALRV